jgi:hypothetical protein
LQVFIDITDLYCLATTVIATPTHSPYQLFRHTHTLSFVKTWRLINAIFTTFPTPLPHAFHFRFYFFFFSTSSDFFHSSVVAFAIVESGSSLGFVCQHELVMMALQHPSAEDGMNWCSEGGLDYERSLFIGYGTPRILFPSSNGKSCGSRASTLDPSALAYPRHDMASPSPLTRI